jgi:hypothetical protein
VIGSPLSPLSSSAAAAAANTATISLLIAVVGAARTSGGFSPAVLFRATSSSKKSRVSTIVAKEDLEAFSEKYKTAMNVFTKQKLKKAKAVAKNAAAAASAKA